jgi:hypothetical protein
MLRTCSLGLALIALNNLVYASCDLETAKNNAKPAIQLTVTEAQKAPSSKQISQSSLDTVLCLLLTKKVTGGRPLELNQPPKPADIAEEQSRSQKDATLQQIIARMNLRSDSKSLSLLLAAVYDDAGYYILRDIELLKIKNNS